MDAETLRDLGGLLVGFVLTLFVFSYVLKDNPLYRLAVHLLIGVSGGYALVVALQEVLVPRISALIAEPNAAANLPWLVPLFAAIVLLFKLSPHVAWIGNTPMAMLMAIGAALGLVGAIVGTLLPQTLAVEDVTVAGLIAAALTICTLITFTFTGRPSVKGAVAMPFWQRYLGFVGRLVLTITLAALFAGALRTSLILLSERADFFLSGFVEVFNSLLS